MHHRKLVAVLAATGLAAGATGVAVAASAPSKVTIKESQTLKVKPNRYIQDGMRWDKDSYTIKSGGTLHVVNNKADEGPHTVTVVKESDLPKTAKQVNNCKICNKLGQAHGFDPNSNAPPKFQYLENGTGSTTAPNVDKPGDSGLTGEGKQGESINMKVTAKAGTTLYFMCLIHPWMQGKIVVR